MEGVEHQVCVCDAKLWLCAARQKASQEQVKEKERRTMKRTSRQTKVMLMKGDMTSHFLSSRGHVLPHTKSNAVKITGIKYKQMPQLCKCMHGHLLALLF